MEQDRILAFLRYVRQKDRLLKLATPEAAGLIRSKYPEYVFHSVERDVELHGIREDRIGRHYRARARALRIAELPASPADPLEARAWRVLGRFIEARVPIGSMGVTGSLLVGTQTSRSDIDLVFYDRKDFEKAREIVRRATMAGEFGTMDAELWRDAYERRNCGLSLGEYVWHERRKHNKLVIDGTKVDISLVIPEPQPAKRWRKLSRVGIRAEVTRDAGAFDYPARFGIRHPEISEIVSYTNTFAGQARRGETVLARGWVEESESGDLRLLVGTSREADGEFIKVVG
jgi:hypothetical protein